MHNPNPHPHRPAEVPPSHQGKFVQILDQAARAGRDSADLSAADFNSIELQIAQHLGIDAAANPTLQNKPYELAVFKAVRKVLDGKPTNSEAVINLNRPTSWTDVVQGFDERQFGDQVIIHLGQHGATASDQTLMVRARQDAAAISSLVEEYTKGHGYKAEQQQGAAIG
jgi:hypothetical protein